MLGREPQKATVLIEFVGAAGVGKSTLTKELHYALQTKGLIVNDFEALAIKWRASNFLHIAQAFHLALQTQPRTLSAFSMATKKIASYQIRRRIADNAGGIHLCSDGMVHKLRKFHRLSKGIRMCEIAEKLFTHIPPPDIVVVVEACADTVYSRRLSRNRSGDRFNRASVQADVRLVEDSIKSIIHIQNTVAQTLQMIRVNTETSDDEVIKQRLIDTVEGFRARKP
jgi:deoxyadenosine/deoxycytidine kinase